MNDLNSVAVIGRATRDGEKRYTSGGMAILTFSIAVNESRKTGDSWTDYGNFFEVAYFGKAAEAVAGYVTKGKQLAVCGRLHQDRWTKDGQNYSKVVINADNVQLLGGGEKTGGTPQDVPEENQWDIKF